jgi:hypothetical protein
MENTTQFDLNDAARQWRNGLESSPAFRPENLHELEAHLRDSAVALQSGEVTPAEAFRIATRRLGARAELEREFGKANVRDLWLDRCLWMILGLLLCFFIYRLSVPLQSAMLGLALSWELSAPVVGILNSLARFAFPLAGIAAVWFCMKKEQFLVRLGHLSLRGWWLSGLAIVLLLYASTPLATRLQWLLHSLFGPTGSFPISYPPGIEAKTASLNAWMNWTGPIELLLWLVLVPLLASYAQRMRTAESTLTSPADTTGTAATERELIQRLQSQGLSLEEACFLAARRREPRPTFTIEATNTRQVAVERALWMVVGVVLNKFIYRFLLEPCWIIAALNSRLTNQAAVYEHVFAGLCFLLELGVAAAFVAGFWRFVTRGHRATEWFTSLCMKRPGRAAVSLGFIYSGIVGGSWVLGTILTPKNTLGLGDIASKWFYWQSEIIQIFIPVALLLWLADSRMKSRRA